MIIIYLIILPAAGKVKKNVMIFTPEVCFWIRDTAHKLFYSNLKLLKSKSLPGRKVNETLHFPSMPLTSNSLGA